EEVAFGVVSEVGLHRWRIGDTRRQYLLLRYSPRRPISASAASPTPAACARRGATSSAARAIRAGAATLGSPAERARTAATGRSRPRSVVSSTPSARARVGRSLVRPSPAAP